MPEDIADLLHRRSDLSTFLVHLTRSRDSLLSILLEHKLEARNAWGMLKEKASANQAFQASQRCICLTETPLEHTWMMCKDIEGRGATFSPYGLAFSKVWARREGANPVWYVDITPGHDWLMRPLNDLAEVAEYGQAVEIDKDATGRPLRPVQASALPFEASQIARIAPFIEQMGTGEGYRKEFWWEREWRKVGTLWFRWKNVVAAFVPEDDHETFTEDLKARREGSQELPPLLDPRWGLERMIAALRGLPPGDVGPLP
jgi:hypothetical protein